MQVVFELADGERQTCSFESGDSLMEQALAAGVPGITGQCGGGITCSTCLCNVPDEWLPRLPPQHQDEIDLLAFVPEAGSNSRLICQIPASEALDGLYLQVVITTPAGDA